MAERTDAEVVAASLATPAAFGDLFDRHATAIHRYLVRRIGPGDAEALMADAFRIAFERRHTYDGAHPNARPWLYGIATNLVAGHRRSEARRLRAMGRLAADRHETHDRSDDIAGALDATDRWHAIAEAIAGLPTGERDALLLHAWEGLSYDEIADALQIPVGTVRSRLNRARTRLRTATPPPRSGSITG